MLLCTGHSAKRRLIFRAAIARLMAFVFLFSLLVPHPAVTVLDASSPAIVTFAHGGGAQPAETADYDLVRHIGCSCHIGAPAQSNSTAFLRTDLNASFTPTAHAPPQPGPMSLPFEPPRA